MCQKQKKERKRKKREKKRPNYGNNNGQATHGARKYAWRTQAAWANYLTQLALHVSTLMYCSNISYMLLGKKFDLCNKK